MELCTLSQHCMILSEGAPQGGATLLPAAHEQLACSKRRGHPGNDDSEAVRAPPVRNSRGHVGVEAARVHDGRRAARARRQRRQQRAMHARRALRVPEARLDGACGAAPGGAQL
jgi:hypothetical protein